MIWRLLSVVGFAVMAIVVAVDLFKKSRKK
jgi:hypothetical protein